MLYHPTLEKLEQLRLFGMAKALKEQTDQPSYSALRFEDRLGLLVDQEATERDNKQLQTRLKTAKLRLTATVEDIDYAQVRGLDKSTMLALARCQWIRDHQNCIITGATGAGKTYLACALGHTACREGYKVLYRRTPQLFEELAAGHADGRYRRLIAAYTKAHLLLLDDWGLTSLTAQQATDFLELIEARYDIRATLLVSQIPVEKWHDLIAHPTLADAALDRLVHSAHRLLLKGESFRKKAPKPLLEP